MATQFISDENTLIRRITERYESHWALNDPAHRREHFSDVAITGLIIKHEQRNFDEGHLADEMIILAAYFHDLFAWSRINHHRLSAEFIMDAECPIITETLEDVAKEHHKDVSELRQVLANGCREHRASYKGKFSQAFSELINAADRGMPAITTWLERSLYCNAGKSLEDAFAEAMKHLNEKLGPDGYGRFPLMWHMTFPEGQRWLSDELEELNAMYGSILAHLRKHDLSKLPLSKSTISLILGVVKPGLIKDRFKAESPSPRRSAPDSSEGDCNAK